MRDAHTSGSDFLVGGCFPLLEKETEERARRVAKTEKPGVIVSSAG